MAPESYGEHGGNFKDELETIQELLDEADRARGVLPAHISDPELDVLIDAALAKQQVLRDVRQGARIEFRRALDVQSRVVADPRHAAALAKRHNEQLICVDFVKAMLLAAHEGDPLGLEALKRLQRHAHDHGYFLLPYTQMLMQDRITSYYPLSTAEHIYPQFLIVEAGARHPSERAGQLHRTAMWHADCQFHLPDPGPEAKPVIALPGKGDEVFHPHYLGEVRKLPQSVALVEDIVCKRDMEGLSLASCAMEGGLSQIVHNINPTRPGSEVRTVAAAISSLQGLYIPEEDQTLLLGEGMFEHLSPIGNDRSMYIFDHFRSTFCSRFKTAWVLKNRHHPLILQNTVTKQKMQYELIVSWYVKVARLHQELQSSEA